MAKNGRYQLRVIKQGAGHARGKQTLTPGTVSQALKGKRTGERWWSLCKIEPADERHEVRRHPLVFDRDKVIELK